jgi:hypothetical protein
MAILTFSEKSSDTFKIKCVLDFYKGTYFYSMYCTENNYLIAGISNCAVIDATVGMTIAQTLIMKANGLKTMRNLWESC